MLGWCRYDQVGCKVKWLTSQEVSLCSSVPFRCDISWWRGNFIRQFPSTTTSHSVIAFTYFAEGSIYLWLRDAMVLQVYKADVCESIVNLLGNSLLVVPRATQKRSKWDHWDVGGIHPEWGSSRLLILVTNVLAMMFLGLDLGSRFACLKTVYWFYSQCEQRRESNNAVANHVLSLAFLDLATSYAFIMLRLLDIASPIFCNDLNRF